MQPEEAAVPIEDGGWRRPGGILALHADRGDARPVEAILADGHQITHGLAVFHDAVQGPFIGADDDGSGLFRRVEIHQRAALVGGCLADDLLLFFLAVGGNLPGGRLVVEAEESTIFGRGGRRRTD
ncbi:MAG: hypothetical protein NTU78_07325 [Alphaproteobacteria bacterium]|nr:hypothetical protein [Alphaproteobacteria bacterium]